MLLFSKAWYSGYFWVTTSISNIPLLFWMETSSISRTLVSRILKEKKRRNKDSCLPTQMLGLVWVCLAFPNTWIPCFWRKRTPVLGIRHPTTGTVIEWTLPGSLLHSLDTLHVPDAYWQSWSEIWYPCCHLSEQGTQHAAWDKEWDDSWVRLTWWTSWMNGWKMGAKAMKPQPHWTEATSSPAQPCSSLALGIVQSA